MEHLHSLCPALLVSLNFRRTHLSHRAEHSWVKIPVNSSTVSYSISPLYKEQNTCLLRRLNFSCGFAYINTTLTHSAKF